MAPRFAKVSEEEIEEAFFYPSDLVSTSAEFSFCVFMDLDFVSVHKNAKR